MNQDIYLNHLLFLSITSPLRYYTTSHQAAGLLCICQPHICSLISSISSTSFSITLSLLGNTIKAVYLPPSLSGELFQNEILVSPVDLLLGDINTHFSKSIGDI